MKKRKKKIDSYPVRVTIHEVHPDSLWEINLTRSFPKDLTVFCPVKIGTIRPHSRTMPARRNSWCRIILHTERVMDWNMTFMSFMNRIFPQDWIQGHSS